jgi:PiT family inorganic phosphate transporter
MRTRIGLILIGAFGAYSLGANNIANVMGVFVSAEPFGPLDFFGLFTLSGAQVLFLIGAIAISVGIITYSHKVMDTVGESLLKLSPITALIVVLSESLVLFIFSSQSLQAWLISHNLPAIPLVPVSSSQAVVGAVIGIGLIKSRHQIRLNVLGEIAAGWVTTPVIAGLITFVFLFFLQNVFNQKVYEEIHYQIDQQVVEYLSRKGIPPEKLEPFTEKEYKNEVSIYEELKESGQFSGKEILEIVSASKIAPLWIDPEKLEKKLDRSWLSKEEVAALYKISGKHYRYHWQLTEDLMKNATAWHFKEKTVLNNEYNKSMKAKYDYIFRLFEEKVKQDN